MPQNCHYLPIERVEHYWNFWIFRPSVPPHKCHTTRDICHHDALHLHW